MPESSQVWVGRAFFIWVSVFNLFAVSLFWAVMADVYQGEQSRRLYGVIAAGGSLGALVGGVATAGLVELIGAPALLLVSLAMLELALWCMFAINARVGAASPASGGGRQAGDEVIGGSAADGFRLALRSPYLLGICGYMFLYTIGSTFLYFLQAQVVDATIDGEAAQTAYFANVDIWVNGLTLVLQLFLTGRLMARIGVGLTLAALPLVSVIGFVGLGLYPVLAAVVVFTVARRVTNFALSRPAREALYVPLSRAEKYKAKNLIDTVVYRVGDQVGAWTNTPAAVAGPRHRRHRLDRGAAGRRSGCCCRCGWGGVMSKASAAAMPCKHRRPRANGSGFRSGRTSEHGRTMRADTLTIDAALPRPAALGQRRLYLRLPGPIHRGRRPRCA